MTPELSRALITAVLLSQHFKREWLPENGKSVFKLAPLTTTDIRAAADAADQIIKELSL